MPEKETDQRVPFRSPTNQLGAHNGSGPCGHWLHLATLAAPLIIGELVQDSEKRWRWSRGVSLGIGLVGEGLWAAKMSKQQRERDSRER